MHGPEEEQTDGTKTPPPDVSPPVDGDDGDFESDDGSNDMPGPGDHKPE